MFLQVEQFPSIAPHYRASLQTQTPALSALAPALSLRLAPHRPCVTLVYIMMMVIYIFGTTVTRNIYAQHGSMDISAKYYSAHCLAVSLSVTENS